MEFLVEFDELAPWRILHEEDREYRFAFLLIWGDDQGDKCLRRSSTSGASYVRATKLLTGSNVQISNYSIAKLIVKVI